MVSNPLYVYSEFAQPLGTLWCCFGRLPSFRRPHRLPGLHGRFPLQVDAEAALRGTARGLHTRRRTHACLLSNTDKPGNTTTSPGVEHQPREHRHVGPTFDGTGRLCKLMGCFKEVITGTYSPSTETIFYGLHT